MMASIKSLAKIGRGGAHAIEAFQEAATVTVHHLLARDIDEATRDAAAQALTGMREEDKSPDEGEVDHGE